VQSSSRLAVVLAAFAVVVALSRPARADDSTIFFAQGRGLRQEGKCAEAILAFRKALELRPDGLGSLVNIAECEEALGRLASARADWWSLRTATLDPNTEVKYPHFREHAEEAYKRLESKVPRLTVRLSGAGLDHVRVTINGQPLHPDLVGSELERDPGPHLVEVSYGGVTPIRAERTLAAGAREVVTLVIPGDPKIDATGDPRKMGTGPSPRRTAGFVMVGVGVASAAAAGIAAIVRQKAISTIDNMCPSSCPIKSQPIQASDAGAALNTGKVANALMDTFAILGGASLAVGIPLIVIGPSSSTPAAPSAKGVEIAWGPAAGGMQMRIGGRF
jgi:hypothetical protein